MVLILNQLLLLLLQGKVKELILTHQDRLLRFGSEIIFQICQHFGVKITILDQSEDLPPLEKFCSGPSRDKDRLLLQNLRPPLSPTPEMLNFEQGCSHC
jgi:hypothetical protein